MLDRILISTRSRSFVTKKGNDQVPVYMEWPVDGPGPFFALNSKGVCIQAMPRATVACDRAVFSTFHPMAKEADILQSIIRVSEKASCIQEAVDNLVQAGYMPRVLVLAEDIATEVMGPDHKLGHGFALDPVPLGDNIFFVGVTPLLSKTALVSTVPSMVGGYHRSGDYFSLCLYTGDAIRVVAL